MQGCVWRRSRGEHTRNLVRSRHTLLPRTRVALRSHPQRRSEPGSPRPSLRLVLSLCVVGAELMLQEGNSAGIRSPTSRPPRAVPHEPSTRPPRALSSSVSPHRPCPLPTCVVPGLPSYSRCESFLRHGICSYFPPFGICPFLLSTESSVTLMPSKVLIIL